MVWLLCDIDVFFSGDMGWGFFCFMCVKYVVVDCVNIDIYYVVNFVIVMVGVYCMMIGLLGCWLKVYIGCVCLFFGFNDKFYFVLGKVGYLFLISG